MSADLIEHCIVPPARDLGDGFVVRRALPGKACRAVGPFVFLDQFGPTSFRAGSGLDVRPHPHIGLATVTYLFDGEILHRDSLGTERVIRPGAVNWMIAGRGIVHSERTEARARLLPSTLAGIQSWVALPTSEEERPPGFAHHGADDLPVVLQGSGCRIRIIAGLLYGERAPVATLSPMGYADALLEHGAVIDFGNEYPQCAVYVASGSVECGGRRCDAPVLLRLRNGERARLRALTASRLMLVAGEPLESPRYVWWNFVSSSRLRIEQAKQRWLAGDFGTVPGDAQEYIPLPTDALRPGVEPSTTDGEVL